MSSTAAGLAIDSVTGIEVALPVAGPGARAYAFIIDWFIRLILALAWWALAGILYNGRLSVAAPPGNEPRWFAAVLVPALALYLLYHYVVELLMRGRTPGKRMAGVRIVSRDGGTPSAGALLLRNVFRLFDSLPVFYGVGLIAAILTREHLRIGDMAAGTLLVFEHVPVDAFTLSGPAAASGRARLEANDAELCAELLQRWPLLLPRARRELARGLLTRHGGDPTALAASGDAALRSQLQQLESGQVPAGG